VLAASRKLATQRGCDSDWRGRDSTEYVQDICNKALQVYGVDISGGIGDPQILRVAAIEVYVRGKNEAAETDDGEDAA
jgi:hypothetical protein